MPWYKGFSRFAVLLSAEEANSIAESPGVVSVFPDPVLELHTTRSWDFLKKIIGARSYGESLQRDVIGKGTHVASTAAGAENNITVVCSAGNDGPNPGSVENSAPWILTVAASTIDREFESNGASINFVNIKASPVYPIMYAKSAKKSGVEENATRPDSMEQELIKGKTVVCDNEDSLFPNKNKQNEVKKLGGIGVILIDDELGEVEFNFGAFSMSVINSEDGVKPDMAAPGVNILGAWIGNDTAETPEGKEPPLYNVLSGTSMSCPHVSGIAATFKSRNPEWSPSAIRTAIMTTVEELKRKSTLAIYMVQSGTFNQPVTASKQFTAAQINNKKALIMTQKSTAATPYDFGAGEVSTTGPLQPGLVYETTTIDYLNFLCYHGYNTSTLKSMACTIPDGFTCPKGSSIDLISNINYPSISISYFDEKAGRKVIRTLTNVAGDAKTCIT
ncbi:putative Basic-leucine zipper transcription factor family protein [Hibiscus syriacus]|uniref:Basic-leucine zipper transcription factor family protein n=1 Tax=Hibiscus syriacus TaxID=106335 RepID=A0A6A3D3W3_HIBSY|nr:putative Basic-leucine zipper transcription factor family protein [Hibiscus syriacus]